MSKTKVKFLSILTIFIILISSILIVNFCNLDIARAETEEWDVEYYTNSDNYLNSSINKNIFEYADSMKHETQKYTVLSTYFSDNWLYASTIKYAGGVLVANNDDFIVQIVPKKLFKSKNSGDIYLGEE